MARFKEKLLDQALQKYNIPTWSKKYILNYLKIKKNKIETIKQLMVLLNKRKKSTITKTKIKLSNNMIFNIKDILYIISLFYFGELLMQKIIEHWLASKTNIIYTDHFSNLLDITQSHKKTIKNLLDGFNYKTDKVPIHIKQVFDYIENISDWNERIVIIGIILQDTYVKSFGNIFYKIFYNLNPEYMKLINQAINYKVPEINWFNNQAKTIIKDKLIDEARLSGLMQNIIFLIDKSIKCEERTAEKMNIKDEVELLRHIAISSLFYDLHEANPNINISKEMKKSVL